MLMEWHNGLLKVLYYVLGLMYESRADKIQLNRPSFSLLDGNPAAWPILREMERQKPFLPNKRSSTSNKSTRIAGLTL